VKVVDREAGEASQALAIESLAAELHVPIDEVRKAYQAQLARLRSGARIPDFLEVFAMRKTRAAFRRRPASDPRLPAVTSARAG
jgi:hypothetical protein